MNIAPLAALSDMIPMAKSSMPLAGRLRRYLRALGPYAALFVLALPFLVVEPLKVVAAVIFGSGHWAIGFLVLLIAYALSIFVVERLFHVVKPKLFRLPWFLALWTRVVALREKAKKQFRWPAMRRSAPVKSRGSE